jgi:hypothetical protein
MIVRSFSCSFSLRAWILLIVCGGSLVFAQNIPPRSRITEAIDVSQRTVLHGNVHPLARTEFDRGAAPPSLTMRRMMLVLTRSPEQQTALQTLLDVQQNKTSPSYHKWLTPEQFGKQFGPSDSDVQTITSWLQSQGFQVEVPSKGRSVIEFSGTAGQVQTAFRTSIHKYLVNGEEHWANSSDPSIPSALAPVVQGVLTLHNFPRHALSTIHGTPVRGKTAATAGLPLFTFTPQKTTFYALGPTDFATIYNVLPLWNAGIDGTGQTIAIVGQSNIHVSDVENFRTLFGLSKNDPQVILNGVDPGIDGDESEALLDVSWSGAVAKNAAIELVVSATTESALGVDLSAVYVVDNNLAPVVSVSYGICEATLGNSGNAFYNSIWSQAAAQGMTVLVAAGDSGSAVCDDFTSEFAASDGLAVSGFASTPYNTAVGGTDFNQTPTTAPTYWNTTNDPTTGASAKSYIPETTWNDSCAGLGADQCTANTNLLNIVAGSGGPSSCSTQDNSGNCLSGYSKPSWQTGTGVPNDGVRDVPDVALFASDGNNNSFYIICEADAGFFGTQETCSLTNYTFVGVGGTSAAAPSFAAIMALVDQKMAGRQGNANYVLYKLAAQNGSSCNSSTVAVTGNSCVFYDITQGNNSVPCNPNTPNCGPAPANGGYGVLVDPNNPSNPAWMTTAGYDLATGLGSVNAYNLVNQWNSVTFQPSTTTLTSVNPISVTHGQPVSMNVTVAPQSGSGTPTGSVVLMAAPSGQNIGVDVFPLTNGLATGTTTLLPGGTYNVTAHYAGDSTYGASDSAPVQVTVEKENSQTQLTLEAYNMTTQTFAPASTIPYGQIFFLRSDVTNSNRASCGPNPQETETACPSGSVNLTLNGATLDAGTYSLNSLGYAEDQSLSPELTTLGANTFQAQYSGDNSFNPSSSSLNVTVTQAPTTIPSVYIPDICCLPNITVDSGQQFQVNATVYTQSIAAAPTGTVTILQNGQPPTGNFQLTPRNGSFTGNYSNGQFYVAYLAGNLTMTINTPGTYTFTASYAGDANYLGTTSPYPATVTVQNTTFNISTPIPNVTIPAPGQTGMATVTLVGAGNFAGTVNIACTLPATMTEATCPATAANLLSNSIAAPLTITTTAPHPITTAQQRNSATLYGFGMLMGALMFMVPGVRRRTALLALLVTAGCIVLLASCGGNSAPPPPPMDPGTSVGTYTVNVTATYGGITRTGTFTVTVQ